MFKLIAGAGDKLASRVLGTVEAGACLPRDYCYCLNRRKYYLNCVGTCVQTSATC